MQLYIFVPLFFTHRSSYLFVGFRSKPPQPTGVHRQLGGSTDRHHDSSNEKPHVSSEMTSNVENIQHFMIIEVFDGFCWKNIHFLSFSRTCSTSTAVKGLEQGSNYKLNPQPGHWQSRPLPRQERRSLQCSLHQPAPPRGATFPRRCRAASTPSGDVFRFDVFRGDGDCLHGASWGRSIHCGEGATWGNKEGGQKDERSRCLGFNPPSD